MKEQELYTLPFDVYTRNAITRQCVNAIAKHVGKKVRVMDFGGRSGYLGEFIPQHELSIIDIREPETDLDKQLKAAGRFFVTDGIKTQFADNAYDIGTSLEVLEHLAPEQRKPALQEMLRVSKYGIIVSAPMNSRVNDAAERTLNSYFERLTGKSHPWLIEHIENRPLPDPKVIEGYLKELGTEYIAIPSNNTFLWALVQYMAFTDCKYKLDIEKIFATYNANFETIGDNQGPAYRNVYVALKPAYATPLKDITAQNGTTERSGEKELTLFNTIVEEFIAQIAERAKQIVDKDVHINNLNVLMHDKDVTVAHQTQLIGEKNKQLTDFQQQRAFQEVLIQNLNTAVGEAQQQLGITQQQLGKVQQQLGKVQQQLEKKELEINQLQAESIHMRSQAERKDKVMGQLKQLVVDKDRHIANITPLFQEMLHLQHSFTYKFTTRCMGIGDKLYADLATARNIIRYEGWGAFFGSLGRYLTGNLKEPIPTAGTYVTLPLKEQYQIFLSRLPALDEKKIKQTIGTFHFQPLISVVVPVYNVKPEWLNKCIESVRTQLYPNWELCLYDDASTKKETVECLKAWEGKDKRIKIGYGKQNMHISGASNAAIKLASGEYIGLLDNDDELTPDALYEVAKAFNDNKNLGFIYSDEDKFDMDGTMTEPHFKSDFNIDLFLSLNYISHFTVLKKSIGDRLGWFRAGFEGSQDYDLYLRFIEHTKHIYHIKKVLYHWRKVPGSTAAVYEDKKYVDKASIRALTEYLQRNNIPGTVERIDTKPPSFRVTRDILQPELVSIIIPFKDKVELLKMCVPSILEKTDYKNYEILLVSNNSTEPETFEYTRMLTKAYPNIRNLEYNKPFNYSAINNWAVTQAKGKYVLLMNNDIEVITPGWLSAMVEHIQRPEVGAVGAKLLYPNNTIQHAGVIVGLGGVAGHSHKYFPRENDGYFGRIGMIQDLSACTAACLLVRKDVYEEMHGLDEKNLKIAFNDVDFCLRIRKAGYLIVYTPFATLYHHESISRGHEDTPEKQQRFQNEVLYMKAQYGDSLLYDPYYNPNLTLNVEDFSLAI